MRELFACGVAVFLLGGSATADEGPLARQFTIAPEDSGKIFMCEHGDLQSVQANAVAEHRPVSIRLLDPSGAPIPDGNWGRPAGFQLEHKASVVVRVVMICAPGS